MKTLNFFKRFVGSAMILLAMATPMFTSCYDDSALNEQIEELQKEVDQIKSDLAALKAAAENGLSVLEVNEIEGGYELVMSDGSKITLRNGADGEKGEKGDKGDTGSAGAKGEKGDKGDTGAQGEKGDKGDTGAQGEKGDKGDTGAQGEKGDKGDPGEDGDAFFKSVELSEDGAYLVITLIDGIVYKLPMGGFNIMFDEIAAEKPLFGEVVSVGYKFAGVKDGDEVNVRILSTGNCTAVVDAANFAVKVTLEAEEAYVDVYALNNTTGDLKARTLHFSAVGLKVTETEFTASPFGGEVEIPVTTAVDYELKIDGDWLTYAQTREIRTETVVLTALENTDGPRTATVSMVEKETERVLAVITVTQKAYETALLGEYIESYSMYRQPKTGTLKIERTDDPSKGTYKVTICGTTLYADYEEGKLNCYDGKYTRTLTVSEDFSRFEVANLSLGYTTYSDYVAFPALGAPELTEAELALVGTYNESWTHPKHAPATNAMVISASEEASFGRLHVKFLVTEDGSAYAGYATLEESVLTVQIGGQSHPKLGTQWNPDVKLALTVNADGTLTMPTWKDENYNDLSDYVATKVVESEGGDEGDGEVTDDPFVGTWTLTYEAAGDMYNSSDPKWASQTGEMTIELKDGNYVLATFVGKTVNWTLTKDGNKFSYSKEGVDLTFTFDEATGQLSTESNVEVTDWVSFKFRNIVATKK